MGFFDFIRHKKFEHYNDEEITAIDNHILKHFGKSDTVYHETLSDFIHVDIILIMPSSERNYITLVTEGMGAHHMKVPKEFQNSLTDRAELICYLPSDWNLNSDDEIWQWPLSWLNNIARLPIVENTWLAFGHTVGMGENESFAENTKLNNILLAYPSKVSEDAYFCTLPNGERVAFYQMIPIYSDELELKEEKDAQTLILKMKHEGISPVIDIHRKNCCKS